MKILFVDIDGVLNHYGPGSGELMEHSEALTALVPKLHDTNVNTFNELVADATALGYTPRIVISSSWRKVASLGTIKRLFYQRGILGEVIDCTPSLGTKRGDEILSWLSEHQTGVPLRHGAWDQIDGFAILDDDSDMTSMMPWLVQTDGSRGFVDSDVGKVLEVLQRKVPWA